MKDNIIPFVQTAETYRKMSERCREDGDFMMSLLYARKSLGSDYPASEIRLADALYECGNFEPAANIFLRLYFNGVRTGEVYGGLVRCFFDMSRYETFDFFLGDGIRIGVFEDIPYPPEGQGRYGKYVAELVQNSIHRTDSAVSSRPIYLVKNFISGQIPRFYDLTSYEKTGNNYPNNELFELVFTTVIGANLNVDGSRKLLEMCQSALIDDPEDIIALSGKVQALFTLRRMEEASIALDELRACELPEDLFDLVRVAFVLIRLRDHETLCDYLEELMLFCEDIDVILLSAIAHINDGNYMRARELLALMLRIDPKNAVCKYYLDMLKTEPSEDIELEYSTRLPEDEIRRRRSILAKLYLDKSGNADNECSEIITWMLYDTDEDYAAETAYDFAIEGRFIAEFTAFLQECGGSIPLKRKITTGLLVFDSTKRCTLFNQHPITIKSNLYSRYANPNDYNISNSESIFPREVYFTALTVIGMYYGEKGEQRLYDTFIKLEKDFYGFENSQYSVSELAAALILLCRFKGFTNINTVCKYFSYTTPEQIKSAFAMMNSKVQ